MARGFDPWSGKIPHAAGQLSLWAVTSEPMRCNKKNHCISPGSPQLDKNLCLAMKTQNSHK